MAERETVATYVAAWNTPDEAERRKLFERCWTDAGVYTDPAVVRDGREELTATCRRFADRWPGAKIETVGDVAAHHGFAAFAWCVRGADGSVIEQGVDFAEFADDGRISRIVGFFGLPPFGS